MKKSSVLILTMAVFFTTIFVSSCKKDEGKFPTISFKSGGNYLNHNDTVNVGDTVYVGIEAAKAEKKDPLKTFDASKSYDGGAAVSFISESLSGSNGDSYSKDMTLIARAVAGKETYIFTVVNKDGIDNSVRLILTVIP